MGCDIHLCVEKKSHGDVWEALRGIDQSYLNILKENLEEYRKVLTGLQSSDADAIEKVKNNIKYYESRIAEASEEIRLDFLYSGRNYTLFAILADVRNGNNFSGIDTGNHLTPIDAPRGLPINVSAEVKQESDAWGCDGHSHSHFTLQELLDFDWNQTATRRGVVNQNEFATFQQKGHPESWCGSVGGRSVKMISNEAMKERLQQKLQSNVQESYYTGIEWKQPYRECVGYFLGNTIPQLQELSDGNFTEIRIVFWFDN